MEKQDDILNKDKTMDNVQKRIICTNIPSSLTFRSYLHIFISGKIQGTSPPGGTLSCLAHVVNLLHVKNLKPQGGLWAKLSAISRPKFR
jgi:hypothetical protein